MVRGILTWSLALCLAACGSGETVDATGPASEGDGGGGPVVFVQSDTPGAGTGGAADTDSPSSETPSPGEDATTAETPPDGSNPPADPDAPCVSSCFGKQCGDDGCGGSCGACVAPKTCENNQCEGECGPDGCDCDLPTSYSSYGAHLITMTIPTDPSAYACDANGDGSITEADGDINKVLAVAAGAGFDANAELETAIGEGKLVVLIELEGYAGGNAAGFKLNVLVGERTEHQPDPGCTDLPGGGSKCDWIIDPKTFDPVTCKPHGTLSPATATNNNVTAGPSDVTLPLNLGGIGLAVPLYAARFKGTIAGQFSLTGGRLCGSFPKAQLISALDKACDDPSPPEACAQIDLLGALLTCDPCTLTIGVEGVPVGSMSLSNL